jgi:hypothetical protein
VIGSRKPVVAGCGHSACVQHFIETGQRTCLRRRNGGGQERTVLVLPPGYRSRKLGTQHRTTR